MQKIQRDKQKQKRRLEKLERAKKKRAKKKRLIRCRQRAAIMVASAASVFAAPVAFGQVPSGGDVVAGQAVIAQAGNTLQITASTDRSIINWDAFSVGVSNSADFNLPGSDSAVLNRVNGTNLSMINGAINSNGNVYLVNSNGIVLGASGVVNTNGFTASTFDISNDGFMAGGALSFANSDSDGSITNNGVIRTGSGGANLIANQIANNGSIASEGGSITLSGGGTVTLAGGVSYVQPSLETLAGGISPTATMIQNQGVIRATGAATTGGEVYLVNPNGRLLHDGTIVANQRLDQVVDSASTDSCLKDANSLTGGRVQLEGENITLTHNSVIDATGTSGGGEVLVGGDWQGSGAMTQATRVTMEAGAKIDVSATAQGDGGKIVLWSDVHDSESITKAFGNLIAQGGYLFGDGGQVETSGKQIQTNGISVNAGADNGAGGLWLIDPYNYVVDAAAANGIVSTLNSGTSVTVTTTANNSTYGSSGSNSGLGDINVSSAIEKTSGGDATLTLNAANSIIVNAAISSSAGALDVTLDADNNSGVGDGGGIVILGNDITTNSGDLRFGTDRTATIGGFTTKVGGDVYVTAGATLSTGGGAVEVSGETILGAVGGLTINTAGGDVTFDGVLNSGNSYSFVVGTAGTGSWESAVADAKNGTSGGDATGDSYIVSITSRLENSIASSVTIDNGSYRGAWIGAYRDRNNTQGNGSTTWHYAGGAETNQPFFSQDGNNSNDSYNNFGSGEPNGTGTGGEYAGQFFGNQALWNDLTGARNYSADMSSQYNVMGYVRETNLAASPLTINAGDGAVTFNAGIGASKALSTLNVTAGSVTLSGNSLVTTGAQNYSSALTVDSTTGLDVAGTSLTAGGALSFAAADEITLGVSIDASGDVSMSGDEILLSGNQAVSSGANDIILTADDVSGAVLTLNTSGHFTYAPKANAWSSAAIGGQLDFTGAISGDGFVGTGDVDWLAIDNYSSLGGLTLGKDGNTSNIRTHNPIDIQGVVNLIGNNITIDGDIETAVSVGTGILLRSSGGVLLAADASMTTGDGDITIDGSVDSSGSARSLTVKAGAGTVTFNGDVGGSSALNSLFVQSAANVNADITSDGSQTWSETITLGGTGDRTIAAGSLTTETVIGGAKNFSLLADSFSFNDMVSGTGDVLIAPKTAGVDIGVGNISGTFSFNNSDFASLQDGFSSITVGNLSSGDLVVGGITELADDLILQAGASGDLFVNDSLAWSSDNSLTLAAGQDIFVNRDIDVSGSAAGLNLFYGGTDGILAPSSGYGYYIDVANGRKIDFAATTAGLNIGNEAYTLVDSVSNLQAMSANGRYALADDLDLSGTTYAEALYSTTFSGKLEGLGHEADGLTVRASAGGNYGLFGQLSGATIRHLGVTGIDIVGQSTSSAAANDLRIGGVAGNVSGSGATVLDGVWSTGVIATKQGSQQEVFYAGGLIGGHESGTLQISRSFSTANVSSQGSHSGKMALGGLLGDTGDYNGISAIGGSAQHLTIDRSYATGSIVEGTYNGYYGSGGLVGVIYGDSATLTDSFSRSNVVGGISSGGIAGYSLPGTSKSYQRLYTTLDRFGNGTAPSDSYKSDTLDGATNNGTQLPSGWSSDIWTAGEFPHLRAVGIPASLLYVQVIGGTGIYGDLVAPSYQIVDIDGNVVTFGGGDYAGLEGVSGTGRYTLGQFTSAGTYNNVSYLSGLGLTGDDADLYALNPFTTAGSFTITPRSITAELSNAGVDKVYDGNVSAGAGFSPTWSFTNIASGDSASLNTGSMFFNDADVLDATLFTINGLSLAGISGSNGSQITDYSLANSSASVAASITPKPIVINGLFANDKIYDGNTTAIIDSSGVTYSGLVSGDSVSLAGLGATFADKNVGAAKSINVVGAFTGPDAGNYSTALPTNLTAEIAPKAITVSGITANNKVYDGTASATVDLAGIDFGGIVSGEHLTATSTVGAFSDKNVANGKTVTLSGTTYGGNDLANYSITGQATAVADITPKAVTVSGVAANDKVYDGTTSATLDYSGVSFSGLVSGDTLVAYGATGGFSDKNVANGKTVTLSGMSYGGADVGNYSFVDQGSTTANITQKAITVSGITANDKVYDASTLATVDHSGVVFGGMVLGDDLSAGGTSGTFASKNVGTNKTVSLSGTTYGGSDAGNYSFTNQSTASADITKKALVVSGITAADKVYDGLTSATLDDSGKIYGGLIAGDDFQMTPFAGSFDSKNVGAAKTVTITSYNVGGTDYSNYDVTLQLEMLANITAKEITVSGITANNKVYDGTTSATLDYSGLSFGGMISGDSLTASGTTGVFSDKNVANGKSVTLSGTTYGGADVGNYSFMDQASTTANITQKAITVSGITANDKVYDGTTAATLDHSSVTFNGMVSGDDLTAFGTVGLFSSRNVANGKAVTLSGTGYGGSDVGNYSFADQSTASASITQKEIAVAGIAAQNKIYDGTTDATLDFAAVSFVGMVSGDDLAVSSATGIFGDKNVGNAKTVSLSGVSYGGTDVGNYSFVDQTTASANINAKSLSVSGISANNKVYDGSNSATVGTDLVNFGGLIAGDEVSIDTLSGQFVDKNVAVGKIVELSTTYSGADLGNYAIVDQATATAAITPKSVIVSGIVANDKTYDGNSVASLDHTDAEFAGKIVGDDLTAFGTIGTFDDKNVDNDKRVTLTGTTYGGTDSGNYSFIDQTFSVASISRLNSVTWIGGASGDWSDPANWAGGAIPDLANVANVMIPEGSATTFDSAVLGPVEIDSLVGGNLALDGGTLNVAGDLSVADFRQNGGNATIGGDFTTTNVFSQSPGATLAVDGIAEINHRGGELTVNSLTAVEVSLNSPNGGIVIGNVEAAGELIAEADSGNITQTPSGTLTVGGEATLQASGSILLDGSGNKFQGTVNVDGHETALASNTGDIELGAVTVTGNMILTTGGGDIVQSQGSSVTVGGETTVASSGDIDLSEGANRLTGAVNLSGVKVEVTQSLGDITLGTVTTTGDFWVDALNGNIGQETGATATVVGSTTLFSSGSVHMPGSNSFSGTVATNAPDFNVNSLIPFTPQRSGAAASAEKAATSGATTRDTFDRHVDGELSESSSRAGGWSKVGRLFGESYGRWASLANDWLESVKVSFNGKDVFIRDKKTNAGR